MGLAVSHFRKLAATLLAIGCTGTAAQDIKQSWYDGCAITLPVYSRHLGGNDYYNNKNYGTFFSCPVPRLGRDISAITGFYRNSFDRDTLIAGLSWSLIKAGSFSAGLSLGLDINRGYKYPKSAKYYCELYKDETKPDTNMQSARCYYTGTPYKTRKSPLIGSLALTYKADRFILTADFVPTISKVEVATLRMDDQGNAHLDSDGHFTFASRTYRTRGAIGLRAGYSF